MVVPQLSLLSFPPGHLAPRLRWQRPAVTAERCWLSHADGLIVRGSAGRRLDARPAVILRRLSNRVWSRSTAVLWCWKCSALLRSRSG